MRRACSASRSFLRGQHSLSQHLGNLIRQHRHGAARAVLAQQMPQRRAIAREVDGRAFDRFRKSLRQRNAPRQPPPARSGEEQGDEDDFEPAAAHEER
jgi:hypothetical protein